MEIIQPGTLLRQASGLEPAGLCASVCTASLQWFHSLSTLGARFCVARTIRVQDESFHIKFTGASPAGIVGRFTRGGRVVGKDEDFHGKARRLQKKLHAP